MKKSEYRAKRHANYLVYQKESLNSWLDHDCEAAEAAGVVWDPEEPELPETIQYAQSGHSPRMWAICPVPEGWESEEQAEASYREAVRRYNDWLKLEGLGLRDENISMIEAERRLRRLAAILDGKEDA